MEVIILAGGIGSRLQSVVSDVPKCMAEVAGKPFLHYLFHYLIPFQPERVILSLGYKHQIVEKWIATLNLPFEVTTKVEESPLGTGGAIKYALSAVKGDSAIVINGDTFFNIDLDQFERFHLFQQAEATIALKPMTNFERYGSVILDEESKQIGNFEEKKYCEKGLINGGIYAIRKDALDIFPEKFSMENDYFSRKVAEGKLSGYISDGFFIDIGIPEDYKRAQSLFK
ncbi:MAG: nucleotidyltransferase family protein [Candidatus Symbiothrix sp.]|jgi:D-glycero-alpha-D-manno-heptose 1-phosphate guanylyltransferase|nr:nucleotidyltransferase family protein [Candidatus Symbiothrix sp.]